VKISAIEVTQFTYLSRRHADSAGHSHPGDETEAQMALLTLTTEDGHSGYAFAPPEVIRPHVVNAFFRKVLIGQNTMDRERLWQDLVHWQRGSAHQLTERDPAKQQQAYFAIQQRYDQLIPALMPISQMVDSVVVNNRVQAYQPHLSATTFLRDVWKTPESLAGGTP